MNAFDLMRITGFGAASAPSSYFVTAKSSVRFVVRAPSGSFLHIDWGNGDSEDIEMTGGNITRTKDYGSNGNRVIRFSGDGNVALNYLECYGNLITSLDVSKNTVLTELYCGSNSLDALDVSKNTALNKLSCMYNSLSALNVTSNTALTYLHCGWNLLASLNVSANTVLNRLQCNNNLLTTLDISHCPIYYLSCGHNALTALPLTTLAHVTNLFCAGCNLNSAAINGILYTLVINEEFLGHLTCNGQIPAAPPTGQGIADKSTLFYRAWSIITD
ncbi:MAG: hypothetical protein ACYC4Q_07300 [Victivallaceae bacterium]